MQGEPEDEFTYVTFFIRFAFVVVSFLTCLVADLPHAGGSYVNCGVAGEPNPSLEEHDDSAAKLCPQSTATFLSEVFFWWFTA